MKRPLTAALVLGGINASIALVTLVLVEVATPDVFGWYAYAPVDEVVVEDPRFAWQYVVVPLALLMTNLLVVRAYLGRVLRP